MAYWDSQEEDDEEEFEEYIDLIPDKVREALKVFVELSEILLDESNDDKTLREAVFSKVPREKIQKAVDIFNEWEAQLKKMEL